MKHDVIYFLPALVVALSVTSLAARADANPDFDDDAKPILRMQPGLIRYVESRFEVKDTGTAKYPGDDDRRPGPPYIFRARPLGSDGPYNFRLLIQPGPPGHILGIVDISKARLSSPGSPSVASQPPPRPPEPPPAQTSGPVTAPSTPPAPTTQPSPSQAPAQPSEPTADTPSGPIMSTGNPPASSQPSLAPPPDPAPSNQ